jgi:putative hemolysin
MKKTILFGLLAVALSACTTTPQSDTETPKIGTANPASAYCIDQGGKLEIRTESNGQVGYCHLKNGQVVEEWELLHLNQPKCIADQAKALVGQFNLTEEQIKQKTKAQIVRMVEPGQAVTMDYREERVTVTVDPASKKIIQASCG